MNRAALPPCRIPQHASGSQRAEGAVPTATAPQSDTVAANDVNASADVPPHRVRTLPACWRRLGTGQQQQRGSRSRLQPRCEKGK
jgi:hypothetical protein